VIVPSIVNAAFERGLSVARRFAWFPPLLARITLGVLFVSTGWGKLHNLDKVTAFFGELGIPAPGLNAHVVSFVELAGGALLVVGLASRLAALPLVVSMLVAIVTAQRDQIHALPDLFGLVEWTYFALLVWVATAGPGPISLDHLLGRRVTLDHQAPLGSDLPAKAV